MDDEEKRDPIYSKTNTLFTLDLLNTQVAIDNQGNNFELFSSLCSVSIKFPTQSINIIQQKAAERKSNLLQFFFIYFHSCVDVHCLKKYFTFDT